MDTQLERLYTTPRPPPSLRGALPSELSIDRLKELLSSPASTRALTP
jgi:hypothetical protein